MLYLEILILIILFIIIFYFSFSIFKGAPFAVTSPTKVKKIIQLAGEVKGKKVVDLGSGDGRLVIALAQAGAEAHGYEINPILAWLSRWKIKKAKVKDKAYIHRQSYWQKNLAEYDIIVSFGIFYIMERLEKKLLNELKPGTIVISNFCKFPHWQSIKEEDKIYLYQKNNYL